MPLLGSLGIDVPAAVFYAAGAVYGTASGIIESTMPAPSDYMPRALKKYLKAPTQQDGLGAATVASQMQYHLLQVAVCGAEGCGKTHLLSRWSTGREPQCCRPSVGADMFREEVAVEGAVVTVVLWDTGGTLQLQRLGAAFLHRADCLLLLADLSDAGSLLELESLWFNSIQHTREQETPCAAVGICRWDLSSPHRQVSRSDMEAWCNERRVAYFEMLDADDLRAVDAATHWLATQGIQNICAADV